MTDRMIETRTDTSLMLAVSRWQEDALAEVYRRYGGMVYGLARRVVADESDAAEITQDVFLRLWNEPERFDPGRGSLRSFLLAQAHGRAVDRVRSEVARRRREERDARDRQEHVDDLDREVSNLVAAEHVKEAVAALPSDERRAVSLAYFNGHSYREVADLLQLPEGTVKSRIRAGLRRLQTSLATRGIDEAWLR